MAAESLKSSYEGLKTSYSAGRYKASLEKVRGGRYSVNFYEKDARGDWTRAVLPTTFDDRKRAAQAVLDWVDGNK